MIALYALFFMLGTGVAVTFGLWNIWVWFKVGGGGWGTVKGVLAVIFSRELLVMLKAFFSNSLSFTRLFRQERLRGLMISVFVTSYLGVIVIGHLMAEALPKIGPDNPIIVFFYAPFLSAYFFDVVPICSFGFWDALYATLDNFLVMLVLFVLGFFAYRRYVQQSSVLRTTWDDTAAILLPGAWIVLRTISKAVSLLQHHVPFDVAKFWVLSYLISQALAPLNLDWATIASVLWPLSGLLLGVFMASMALNSKLWHIFAGPLVVLANSVSKPVQYTYTASAHHGYTPKQVMEIDGCLSCGICAYNCEVYSETANPGTVYVGILNNLRSIMRRRYGPIARILRQEKPTPAELKVFSRGVYYCTLCARCREVCPIGIDTRSLGKSIRESLVTEGHYPANLNLMRDSVASNRNVLGLPNSERAMWVDYLPNPDETLTKKTRAEVAYFVGCMSSFSPTVQDVPVAFAQILQHGGVDFAILGEKEWCCGYPLVWAGMSREAEELRKSNIDRMTELGVKTAVFSCPSCYHSWRTEYDVNIELLHHTQYILRLIKEGRIHLKPLNLTVTYHDPCDLGRNSGEYDAPRDVIKSIPDISFVEMRLNREKALCCGGGGDVEVADENFPSTIAKQLISLAKETGAGTIVTACQQCKRTMVKALSKEGAETSSLKVIDLAELVIRSIEGSG
jgi:heterodisulfide reductase subunit D